MNFARWPRPSWGPSPERLNTQLKRARLPQILTEFFFFFFSPLIFLKHQGGGRGKKNPKQQKTPALTTAVTNRNAPEAPSFQSPFRSATPE